VFTTAVRNSGPLSDRANNLRGLCNWITHIIRPSPKGGPAVEIHPLKLVYLLAVLINRFVVRFIVYWKINIMTSRDWKFMWHWNLTR